VIGLCAGVERVQSGPWDEIDAGLPQSYVAAVQRAGGLALLLPPDESAVTDPDELLDRVDALLLAGGGDIDPDTYGAEREPETARTYPPRDRFEVALGRRAIERDMPVLGICRGLQMLNVLNGGTLIQDIQSGIGHRAAPGVYGDHEVELVPGSLAAAAVGATRADVRSHHHQAVENLGAGLVVSGHSLDDQLTEAIEMPDRRFALGVLWHPEVNPESRVIAALVEEARARAAREAA
jgi:putative glutamine amidotransferase